MGWQDRGYSDSDYRPGPSRMAFGGFRFPRMTPMVKKLIIANVLVYILHNVFRIAELGTYGAFYFEGAVLKGQIWRFLTYQYLHSGVWHIFMNMFGLYFLGNLMEQRWGPRKFLVLYTLFGIAGAILYALLSALDVVQGGFMIGASGSVLGLIGACAVAAPQVMVILLIFPVPIRTAAIILGALSLLSILGQESDRIAHACHLGGLAFGALWAYLEARGFIRYANSSPSAGTVGPSGRKWVQVKIRKGAWDIKMKRKQALQAQIDQILQKVHQKGLNSLTRSEKKILQQASKDRS